jgi:hypothetical protein
MYLINLFVAGVLIYALRELWKKDEDIETLTGWYEERHARLGELEQIGRQNYLLFTADIAELKKQSATLKGQITKLKKKAGTL